MRHIPAFATLAIAQVRTKPEDESIASRRPSPLIAVRRHLRITEFSFALRLAPDDGVFRHPEQIAHRHFWKEFYVIRERRRHKMRICRICCSRRGCAVVAISGYTSGESALAISGDRLI